MAEEQAARRAKLEKKGIFPSQGGGEGQSGGGGRGGPMSEPAEGTQTRGGGRLGGSEELGLNREIADLEDRVAAAQSAASRHGLEVIPPIHSVIGMDMIFTPAPAPLHVSLISLIPRKLICRHSSRLSERPFFALSDAPR